MVQQMSCWGRVTALLLAVYWVAIFTATHVPKLPGGGQMPPDKLLHFTAYLVLALLWAVAWSARSRLGRRAYWTILLAALVYGGLDEGLQRLVPGRHADWYDWLANALGALTGLALHLSVRCVLDRLSRQPATGQDRAG